MSTAETHMDLDRITHPLRLARGSHQPGSGKGCAMNAISYINGDTRITDFPTRSARPLSILVQSCNDLLAGPGGYLSPENSVLALELAWQTVGTADRVDVVRAVPVRGERIDRRIPNAVSGINRARTDVRNIGALGVRFRLHHRIVDAALEGRKVLPYLVPSNDNQRQGGNSSQRSLPAHRSPRFR